MIRSVESQNMLVKWVLRFVRIAGVLSLVLGGPAGSTAKAPQTPVTTRILQGRVYEGEVDDQSTPLEGVTLSLYGANNEYPDVGVLITSATTDTEGWYGLTATEGYEYYHIRQTDATGYESAGATSVSGVVQTSNWIEYAAPLDDQTFTGNKFWDRLETPTWTLQGRVYQGEVGDQSTPLEGVTVSLYGANNPHPDAGQLISSTVTSSEGWYGLAAASGYEYYHIRQTDPTGYDSVGATTVDGAVQTSNWIEYAIPLDEQTLTGNKFWDVPTDADPDLVVTDLWDEGASICYQIENAGDAAAPAGHSTVLFVDGAEVSSQAVSEELDPGDRHEGCFGLVWTCSAPEDQVIVETDEADAVAESDEGNNTREESLPCDDVAPEITSGPEVTSVDQNAAVIWWTTNETSDSLVRYGARAGEFASEEADPSQVTTHEVSLTGLNPSTTYRFVVQSADLNTNTVESRVGVFQTLPEPDDVDPSVSLRDPGEWAGIIDVEADASDNKEVERVEFLLDDVPIFTAYSSPYVMSLDTSRYANGEHSLATRAFDLAGRSNDDDQVADFHNLLDQGAPTVEIVSPVEGATVSGNPITITATLADDLGLLSANFFVYSGTQNVTFDARTFSSPYPTQIQVSFLWNTYHDADAEYYISVQAVDNDANFTTANRYLTLNNVVPSTPPQYPWLEVIKHSVTRVGNYFTVEIAVKNSGNLAASNIEIRDGLRSFQPISTTLSNADLDTWYDPQGTYGYMRIRPKSSIPAGGQATFSYNVVPVMYYMNPPTPSIGSFVDIQWQSPALKPYYSYDQLPVLKTTGGQTIPQAHASALQTADYLLVTNPYRLFLYFAPAYTFGPSASTTRVNQVLSTMAELARYRNGVLAFYNPTGRPRATVLRDLLQPGGAWGSKMGSNFTTDGYLLIVGEFEIVESFLSKGWGYQDGVVNYTDQPFTNTAGDKYPEISVSRIPGNQPQNLITALGNSLEVIKGTSGYGYDRSHALLTSGTGSGQSNFVQNVEDIAVILGSQGVTAEKLHWKDFAIGSSRLSQFTHRARNHDIIFYRDHAGVDVWGNDGDLQTTDFPIDFGTTNPFVYSSACLAGNYEKHPTYSSSVGGDDYNILEAFMDSGAAVYLGATEVSPRSQNSKLGRLFFNLWYKHNLSLGATLTLVEKYAWGWGGCFYCEKYRFWVYEYNMYGDPKFGVIPVSPAPQSYGAPSVNTSPSSLSLDRESSATAVLAEPVTTLDVEVPDYQINSVEGVDDVEIPDGLWWLVEGMPEVPIYPVWVEVPQGYKVQDVTMSSRGGLTEATGLNLPLASEAPDLAGERRAGSASADETEWLPDGEFEWTTVENPDGSSSLLITVFPFYYNTLTTDVAFYQDYSFEIDYVPSSVEVTSLTMGSDTYAPGDVVAANLGLRNTGQTQDVVVSAVIAQHGTDELVEGLLLSTLEALTGTASFAPQWDSSGAAAGLYDVDVTLRDETGNLLDRESQMFYLGASAGEMSSLTATPGEFDIGDTIDIAMQFSNTGSAAITGTATIRVLDDGGETVEEFSDEINGLAAGSAVTLAKSWDTTGEEQGTYGVVGHVIYDSASTGPVAVVVTTQRRVYLPLISKHP